MMRKKITNKQKFQFREDEVLAPKPFESRNSFQARLARKSDNKLPYNQALLGSEHGMLESPKVVSNNNKGEYPVEAKIKEKMDAAGAINKAKGQNDPILDQIVAKLKMKSYLQHDISSSSASMASVQVEQDPTGYIACPMAAKNAAGSSDKCSLAPSPSSFIPVATVGGCICLRPLKLVMCEICGETFRARVSLVCSVHPRAIYLQDVKECKGCKQTNKEALKEFDLPPGMENVGKKTRRIGSG